MISTNQVPPCPRLQVDNPLLLRLKPALFAPKLEPGKHPTGPGLQEHHTRLLHRKPLPEDPVRASEKDASRTGLEIKSLLGKIPQHGLFVEEFSAQEGCAGVRLQGGDRGKEDLEGGAGGLYVGAEKEASGLGLDFDEIGGALGYYCVSFGEGFAGFVSSDAGLEGGEEGFVRVEGFTFLVERISGEKTSGVCLDLPS